MKVKAKGFWIPIQKIFDETTKTNEVQWKMTNYTPEHSAGDLVGIVIDFLVEYGIQIVSFAEKVKVFLASQNFNCSCNPFRVGNSIQFSLVEAFEML
jgi:hypothetical protein